MKIVSKMPVVRYENVGKCIYCGKLDPGEERKFTDEHIFPLSLGGTYILPEHSCKKCQKIINDGFESTICSSDWGIVRTKLGLPSRGKTLRKFVRARTTFGTELKILIDDYPAFVVTYRLGTARLLSGSSEEQNRDLKILAESIEKHNACKAKYPFWDEQFSFKVNIHLFARLIAKIGYGWVIAQAGSAWFRESITPIILGIEEDYTKNVGGDLDGYQWRGDIKKPPGFYIKPVSDLFGIVIVNVAFIQEHEYSRYHVILSECDLIISDDRQQITFCADRGRMENSIAIERKFDDLEIFMINEQQADFSDHTAN